MKVGILGYGVYIPRYRIKKEEYIKAWGSFTQAVSEKSVPRFDEDVVTMAVEAAKNALEYAGINAGELNIVYVGTTSSPYSEKLISSTIASAIGASTNVCVADFGSSTKAGTSAFLSCVDFIASGRGKLGLVVASDCPLGRPGDEIEEAMGAAAVAYIIGVNDAIASIEDYHSVASETWGGRFRINGKIFSLDSGITALMNEEYVNIVCSAAKGLMDKLGTNIKNFRHVILQQLDSRLQSRAVRNLGISSIQLDAGDLFSRIGDVGACSPLIGCAAALDKAKPGERILLVSYGSGAGGDAFCLYAEEKIEEIREKRKEKTIALEDYLNDKVYIDYVKYLRWRRMLAS
jgi:hydroxymethylglutaryl-CoA synthase